MRAIVLYGLPGVGKLSIARGLAQLRGYRVFHNHLVFDAVGHVNGVGFGLLDDAEENAGALIIEYVFENAAPTQAQIEHALRCWRNPQLQGCAVEDVGP